MIETSQITEFGKVFIYLVMGVLLVLFSWFIGSLVAPKRPNPLKLSSYECGEEPEGSSWIQYNSKFYVIALVFLLFDVEMVFIFPWATVFGQELLIQADPRWGWLSLTEMFIFVGILLTGLLYVWKKGDLNWIKPEPPVLQGTAKIPLSVYEKLNIEKYNVRKFSPDTPVAAEKVNTESKQAISKPSFRPQFKKTDK
jgi:NADH-quinone oxidoreductase subunit A